MGEIVIRKLAADRDTAAFRELRLQALRTTPSAYSSDLSLWEAQSEADWQKRLDVPVFGAFAEGQLIGITGIWPETLPAARHRASIVMVYVQPEWRGQSLSQRLVQAAMDHARGEGFTQLELMVTASNLAAKAVYERLGFREYGRLPTARQVDGIWLEDIMMTVRLG